MACGEVPGTQYVIEGVAKQEVATLQGVNRLGGHASENLGNLARLAGISMNIIHVPEGVTLDQVKALPGVRVVEGKFFHPFYDKGLLGGLIPSAPLKPTHLVASFVQLLPPHIFAGLPAQEWVSNLTNLSVSDSQALQPFSSKNYPFGVPGLTLGKKETKGEAATRGGMDEILDHLQVPAAWDSNQGENMIVGVIDSGVSPAQVPPENRAGGWSEHGEQNPWSDANGHGSMCAGIIQQVAPKSKIIALRPMVSADGNMSSLGTISALNYLAGKAQELNRPIISNHAWGIFGVKNLILPCSIVIARATRLLDELGLVMTSWAAGNNRELAGEATISGYCMSTTRWSTSTGALTRNLKPQPYSSLGGQCFPFQPTVSAPTFGFLPWGSAWMDFGDQGGGTSSCAPMLSGVLAMMMAQHPGRSFREYRAAVRTAASNTAVGLPGIPYNPATGAGLIQAADSIRAVPNARLTPAYMIENTPTSVPLLGQEPEFRV